MNTFATTNSMHTAFGGASAVAARGVAALIAVLTGSLRSSNAGTTSIAAGGMNKPSNAAA